MGISFRRGKVGPPILPPFHSPYRRSEFLLRKSPQREYGGFFLFHAIYHVLYQYIGIDGKGIAYYLDPT